MSELRLAELRINGKEIAVDGGEQGDTGSSPESPSVSVSYSYAIEEDEEN